MHYSVKIGKKIFWEAAYFTSLSLISFFPSFAFMKGPWTAESYNIASSMGAKLYVGFVAARLLSYSVKKIVPMVKNNWTIPPPVNNMFELREPIFLYDAKELENNTSFFRNIS